MSLAAEFAPYLGHPGHPDADWWDQSAVYDTWDAWLAAAKPLIDKHRSFFVHHDKNGVELETPETCTRYWQGDCAGFVISKDGVPVQAFVYRKVDDETLELVFVLGRKTQGTRARAWLWDRGYKKVTYLSWSGAHERHDKHRDKAEEDTVAEVTDTPGRLRVTSVCKRRPRPRKHAEDPDTEQN